MSFACVLSCSMLHAPFTASKCGGPAAAKGLLVGAHALFSGGPGAGPFLGRLIVSKPSDMVRAMLDLRQIITNEYKP